MNKIVLGILLIAMSIIPAVSASSDASATSISHDGSVAITNSEAISTGHGYASADTRSVAIDGSTSVSNANAAATRHGVANANARALATHESYANAGASALTIGFGRSNADADAIASEGATSIAEVFASDNGLPLVYIHP